MPKKVKTLFMAGYKGETNVPYFVGADGTQYSPDDYAAMRNDPAFEESLSVGVLQEFERKRKTELRESSLGTGWVKVTPKTAGRFSPSPSATTSTRSRITEDDAQSLLATRHSLTARGFVQDGNNWTRGAVTVFVAADGSWKCGKDVGQDKATLESTLDSKYPHESFRHRLTEAFQSLGHSPREAEIASRANESVLLDAWTVIMGGNRDAARHARGHREVDHRIGILSDTRSR